MTIEELLPRLDGVRRCGRGWMARCPAHDDKNPSLSVCEGDKGILLKCWAGCTVAGICAALGLRMADLFADVPADLRARQEAAQRRERERRRREAEALADGAVLDTRREADRLTRSARALDISGWDDARLAREMDALADAYDILEAEQRRDYVHE